MLDQQKINGVPCAFMGCCGIFAASLVTGKEPQEIFDLYKKENSKSNRWRGGTHESPLLKILTDHYGLKLNDRGLDAKWCTIKEFYLKHGNSSSTYIVYTARHVSVIDKGRLIDQVKCGPVGSIKGNRCRLKSVYEVLNSANIPSGKISGTLTQENKLSKGYEQASKNLHKGLFKYGLSSKIEVEYQGMVFKLFGYQSRNKRFPFLIKVTKKNGKPISEIGKLNLHGAQKLFSIHSVSNQAINKFLSREVA